MESGNYFSDEELNCQHCGEEGVLPDALALLNAIRIVVGRPIRCTSAYRCDEHPIERSKPRPGQHNKGHAFDLWHGGDYELQDKIVALAETLGFNGIGTGPDFVHIDRRSKPARWTY